MKPLFLLFLIFSLFFQTYSQNTQEIIAKTLESLGGKKQWSVINSI